MWGTFAESLKSGFNSQLLLIILMTIMSFFAIYFTATIKEYTPYGKKLVGEVEGFRNFIETAKTDEMEMIFKEDPSYFYDILPFAMVLRLTNIWERKVADLSLEQPDWYISHSGFRASSFGRSMARSLTQTTSTPSSSSSGGSSGGGGGGGGGGSW
jgi:uncharacterized membrane protein YgcG